MKLFYTDSGSWIVKKIAAQVGCI